MTTATSSLPQTSSLVPPAPAQRLRVVLADDHPVVRAGIGRLIAEQPDMQVVGEARDGDEAFRAAAQLRPDILLLDVVMPGVNGLEAARQIKRSFRSIKIIGLSISEDPSCIKEMMTAGADGFVLKRAAADELVAAIRIVHRGGVHLDPRIAADRLADENGRSPNPRAALTPRENSIIRLVARGFTNKEIASMLDLSVKTVENAKARAMEKAGLRNRVDIVRHGAERGWLMEGG